MDNWQTGNICKYHFKQTMEKEDIQRYDSLESLENSIKSLEQAYEIVSGDEQSLHSEIAEIQENINLATEELGGNNSPGDDGGRIRKRIPNWQSEELTLQLSLDKCIQHAVRRTF